MTKRCTILFGVEILLIIILVMVNIHTGSTDVSLSEALSIIVSGGKGDVTSTIILDIRLPRIIAAFVLGGALALSGYLLQSFFHNPIAGPFVLGISSGAKLVVALLMVAAVEYGMVLSSVSMIVAALFGSLMATVFVILVAKKVHNMSILIVC
nr:iron ABC transporter permease [Lachnospiraceae bacterium]